MNSNSLIIFGAVYLGVGLVIGSAAFVENLLANRRNSFFALEVMAALNPKRDRLAYRILEDILVPTLAFILICLTWPLAIIIKLSCFKRDKSAQ